jgi:hypothetical protein
MAQNLTAPARQLTYTQVTGSHHSVHGKYNGAENEGNPPIEGIKRSIYRPDPSGRTMNPSWKFGVWATNSFICSVVA